MSFNLQSVVKSVIVDEGRCSHRIDRDDLKFSGDSIIFTLDKGLLIEDIEFEEFSINSVFVKYKCEYRIDVIDAHVVSEGPIEAKTAHYKSIVDLEYLDLDLQSECVERFEDLDFASEKYLKDKLERYVYNEETEQDFSVSILTD